MTAARYYDLSNADRIREFLIIGVLPRFVPAFVGAWLAGRVVLGLMVSRPELPLWLLAALTALPIAAIAVYWRLNYRAVEALAVLDEQEKREQALAAFRAAAERRRLKEEQGFVGLSLGDCQGLLAARGHVAGVIEGRLDLAPEDCCKNLLILGGIGSGKTTRTINPLLKQVLEQDTGALIFDIKGDFRNEVDYVASITERTVETIGIGGATLNLIGGTTPEVAASYLKSCFVASGSASGNGAFFVNSAVELCRNCLQLLRMSSQPYSLAALRDLVVDETRRTELISSLIDLAPQFDHRRQRLLEAAVDYFENTWARNEEKLRSNVLSTVAEVLSPFTHPDMVDAFSTDSLKEADLTRLVNEGVVYFVNIPFSKLGREGARLSYLLIKLRFFDVMRARRAVTDWDQRRYVAFVCDEYQSIVDSISDTDFWDKSRSSKTIGIVSMQGVSSLVKAVGEQKDADAILQNFRQRLIFRTEDLPTLQMAQALLGTVDVERVSENTSAGTNQGPTGGQSASQSGGYSVSVNQEQLFSANDMRGMDANYALFIGNVGSKAVDETIRVHPLYVS